MKIIAKNINPKNIALIDLTRDCLFVYKQDTSVDIVQVNKMSEAFDYYYDEGIEIDKLVWTGGLRNPKTDKPKLST